MSEPSSSLSLVEYFSSADNSSSKEFALACTTSVHKYALVYHQLQKTDCPYVDGNVSSSLAQSVLEWNLVFLSGI